MNKSKTIYNLGKFITAVTLLLLMVYGCSDRTIAPYEGERAIYSMYGALEVGKTPNYIRIKDLQVPFNQENPTGLSPKRRLRVHMLQK